MIFEKDVVNLGIIVYIKVYTLGGNENMSEKEVIVSNVSKKHENPIAELVQVACKCNIIPYKISRIIWTSMNYLFC